MTLMLLMNLGFAGGGAAGATTILPQMLQQGLFVGSAR